MSVDGSMNTHMLYFDELHRDHGAIMLCWQALEVLNDTILFGRRIELLEEHRVINAWHDAGNSLAESAPPPSPLIFARLKMYVLENLKIASAFELYVKARLIVAGYVVHLIRDTDPWKALHAQQKTRPVLASEMTAVEPYINTQTDRYLPGLEGGSLPFSRILQKPEYVTALGLRADEIEIINEYRDLRNQIHLPGDLKESPRMAAHGDPLRFLLDFVNLRIVDWSSSLVCGRVGLGYLPLLQHVS